MTFNDRRTRIVWPILFGLLLAANVYWLVTENLSYANELKPLHEFLVDDLESVIPDNAVPNWANYTKRQETVKNLSRLRPPFWKQSRHMEYLNLVDDLETEQSQVQLRQTSPAQINAGLAMFSGLNSEALKKTLEEAQQRQAALRLQLLPKYKEKIEKLKRLYQSLD